MIPFIPRCIHTSSQGNYQERGLAALATTYRILFEFVDNPESGEEEILLLTVGSHDEVY